MIHPKPKSCERHRRALESGSEITELRSRVEAFAGSFAMPGFDVTAIDHSATTLMFVCVSASAKV